MPTAAMVSAVAPAQAASHLSLRKWNSFGSVTRISMRLPVSWSWSLCCCFEESCAFYLYGGARSLLTGAAASAVLNGRKCKSAHSVVLSAVHTRAGPGYVTPRMVRHSAAGKVRQRT